MLRNNRTERDIYPGGFLFQKDIYTTNLLFFHQKCKKEEVPQFLDIYERVDKKYDLLPLLQIKKEENNLSSSTFNKSMALFPKRKQKKLKFPLPKVKIQSLSSIDFYQKYKGDYKLCYMDDDLNITSKKMKKFVYCSKEPTHQTHTTDVINTNKINDTFLTQSTLGSKKIL